MAVDIREVREGNAYGTTVVDPRAAVDAAAKLGRGCTVGPFAVIDAGVTLGPECVVASHAVIQGPAEFGAGNLVQPFACLGGPPQDLRYRGEPTKLIVGDNNIFREHVTVSRGTLHGGGVTRIGDDNLLMAGCHVAHDCIIGSHVVMANNATVAGHVVVEDYVVFGGMAAVGAFLRIGESAMLAAGAMIEREVPPFCIVAGDRARLRAVNRVGMDRRGINGESRVQIKEIFRSLRRRDRSVDEIVREQRENDRLTPEARHMLDFISGAQRGLTR